MRQAKTYRNERRNDARANKIRFPWEGIASKYVEPPPIRPPKRDRSPEAEARRAQHITMDFTDGAAGISRAMIQHKLGTIFKKKPKRGWAAQRRRAPFVNYLEGDKLHKARMRHAWYRKHVATQTTH